MGLDIYYGHIWDLGFVGLLPLLYGCFRGGWVVVVGWGGVFCGAGGGVVVGFGGGWVEGWVGW